MTNDHDQHGPNGKPVNRGLARRDLIPAIAAGSLLVGAPSRGASFSGVTSLHGVIKAGPCRIEGRVEFAEDVWVMPGGWFELSAGSRLVLKGGLIAAASWIFRGAGVVELSQSRIPAVYAEWWGARADDPEHDCLPALTASLSAHRVLHLLPGDYYLSAPWRIDLAHSHVWGAGGQGNDQGQGTRLILREGGGDVVRVGPARRPGSVNDYPRGIDIRWLTLSRDRVATDPDASGLRACFVLDAHFEGITAREHSIGFYASGLVHCYLANCVAFRSLPSGRPGLAWRGFYLDGMADIGLAGGNASIFLTDCNATIGGDPQAKDPVGLMIDGAFADSFITRFETAGVATGIRIAGKADALGARAMAGHVDLHIAGPVIDQCGTCGIDISDTAPGALIDIQHPYVALAPKGRAAVSIVGVRGSCYLSGGQFLGRDANALAFGMKVQNSEGLQCSGLKLLDFAQPLSLDGVCDSALAGWIGNPHRKTRAAIQMVRCSRITMAMAITGCDGAFGQGVLLGPSVQSLRIDTALFDSSAISTPIVDGENAHLLEKATRHIGFFYLP